MQFYACECFFSANLFIKEYKMHVTFHGRDRFLREYGEVLKMKGCRNPEDLVQELEEEVLRRQKLQEESWRRRQLVASQYTQLNPHIFTLQASFLDPKFQELICFAQEAGQDSNAIISRVQNHQSRIYSFPVFTHEFCRQLLQEVVNFEESPLPKGRPNTMNQYGINLGELGFDDVITRLREDHLSHLTRLLYPDWGGDTLDSHKAFIVTYKEGMDVELEYHYDNAEVTMNISLNEDYSDGDLYFGPLRTETSSHRIGYSHQLGHGLLHLGQQLHGALPISQGTRYNLIIWMRSSRVRNRLCPMCDQEPSLVPVKNGFGDGFTAKTVNVCSTS